MKAKMCLIISIIILLGSFCYGDEYWESIYTSDSNIYCLAINADGDLFVGIQRDVYKSTDNGINGECVGLENVKCLFIND